MFKTLFNGVIWSVGLTWISRFIGLFSVIIIARILTPEDYGIVAIAMLVIHLLQNITAAGTLEYLVYKKEIHEVDIRTTWTIVFLLRAFLSCSLFLSAGFVANYFNEPQLEQVFQVLCLLPLIESFKNMQIVIEEININYKPVFLLGLARKIVAFATTLLAALNGSGFWSLIYGELAGCAFMVLTSYVLLPVKISYLKPSLSNAIQQIKFYSWSYLQVFVGFTRSKIDSFFIAKYVGTVAVGQQNMSSSLAELVSNELSTPIVRPIYSGLAKYTNNSEDQISLLYKAVAAMSVTVCFFSFLLASTAAEVVNILLGEKWSSISTIVAILGVAYSLHSVGSLLPKVLTAHGLVKQVFILDLICLFIVVIVIGGGAIIFQSLLMVSYARLLASLFSLIVIVFFTIKITEIDMKIVFIVIAPSYAFGSAATLFTLYVYSFFEMHVIASLFFKSALFVICFSISLYIWCRISKFNNYEMSMINNLRKIFYKKSINETNYAE